MAMRWGCSGELTQKEGVMNFSMKQIQFFIFLLVIFSFSLSTPLCASEVGFGFHGGFMKSQSMDSGFYFGGQMRYKLSPAFGFEFALSYRDEETTGDLRVDGQETRGTTIARSYPLTATAVFTLFAERQFPINLMGGFGVYYYSLTFRPDGQSEEEESDVRFGYHLGAGTEYPISLGVKLEGSLKYLFLDLENEYGDVVLSNSESNAFMINLGLTFYF